ncbi:MAG: glycerol-3-phosphate cytidylyltransferase [Spirochaetes bacterium]|nr:MAG: glycerol-3-phosphate cytidylyltransferase [Spirochaetota bacterium]
MVEEDWKEKAKKILKDKYGRATVYTGGTFDLLHRGHINIFKKAKEIGSCLVVAVSTNKLVRSYKGYDPILNYNERAAIVKAIRYVDKVVKQTKIFDVDQFQRLGADIFIIGDDWENRNNIPSGLKWLKENNKVLFVPYTKRLSTTYIKRKIIKQSYEIIHAEIEREFKERNNFQ